MNKLSKNILPDKVSIWKSNKSNFILIHLLFVGIVGKVIMKCVLPHIRVIFRETQMINPQKQSDMETPHSANPSSSGHNLNGRI